MIDLTFSTWHVPMNNDSGLSISSSHPTVCWRKSLSARSTWACVTQPGCNLGALFPKLLSFLSFLAFSLSSHLFYFIVLYFTIPFEQFEHLSSCTSTLPCRFNDIQAVFLGRRTKKSMTEFYSPLTDFIHRELKTKQNKTSVSPEISQVIWGKLPQTLPE